METARNIMYTIVLFLIFTVFFAKGTTTPICDKVCVCSKDSSLVDCSRINSKIIPFVDMWPENVTELTLSFNFITDVDVEMTHGSLTSLKLNNNNIKFVNRSVFGGLSSLKFLDLSYNAIEDLEMETFYGLEILEVLNIGHNLIKTLPHNVFFNLLEMEELIVSSNPFSYFEKVHFHDNINLKKLNAVDIGAYALPFDVFSTLPRLEQLDLSDNSFHEVPTDALRSAKNLKLLQFNGNPIEELTQKSFRQLTSLETLQLNLMPQLKTVGPNTFSALENLKSLEMRVNKQLSRIDGDAFLGLFNGSNYKLRSVDLELNHLSMLSRIPCKDMKKLNLQRNPWTCDCHMKWLRKCYIPEIYAADLKCTGPSKAANHLLISVPDRDFVCDVLSAEVKELIHHNRVLRAVSLAFTCMVMLLLAALVIFVLKFRSIKTWYKNKKRGQGAVYYVRAKTYPTEN